MHGTVQRLSPFKFKHINEHLRWWTNTYFIANLGLARPIKSQDEYIIKLREGLS